MPMKSRGLSPLAPNAGALKAVRLVTAAKFDEVFKKTRALLVTKKSDPTEFEKRTSPSPSATQKKLSRKEMEIKFSLYIVFFGTHHK